VLSLEHLQPQRDGYDILGINNDQRPEEIIPESDKCEEAQHTQRGNGRPDKPAVVGREQHEVHVVGREVQKVLTLRNGEEAAVNDLPFR